MATSVMLQKLGEGMVTSLWIFAVTLIFSLPLGLLISFGRMSKNKIISTIFKLYISVMRGTPLMLQLMVIYFGPFYILGVQISQSWKNMAVAIGFVLNYAAYFAEIYRGGIESMPQGQYEAAKILGYIYNRCDRDVYDGKSTCFRPGIHAPICICGSVLLHTESCSCIYYGTD